MCIWHLLSDGSATAVANEKSEEWLTHENGSIYAYFSAPCVCRKISKRPLFYNDGGCTIIVSTFGIRIGHRRRSGWWRTSTKPQEIPPHITIYRVRSKYFITSTTIARVRIFFAFVDQSLFWAFVDKHRNLVTGFVLHNSAKLLRTAAFNLSEMIKVGRRCWSNCGSITKADLGPSELRPMIRSKLIAISGCVDILCTLINQEISAIRSWERNLGACIVNVTARVNFGAALMVCQNQEDRRFWRSNST